VSRRRCQRPVMDCHSVCQPFNRIAFRNRHDLEAVPFGRIALCRAHAAEGTHRAAKAPIDIRGQACLAAKMVRSFGRTDQFVDRIANERIRSRVFIDAVIRANDSLMLAGRRRHG
jgi:hypothetical protein